jgi:purine nucleosidase
VSRKVIIDMDPGIGDAVALALALFDPRLDVIAVTAVGGNVPAEQATRNVQALIEQLDPPRLPRIGVATAPENVLAYHAAHLQGNDGLGNAELPVSRLARQHPSEKIIVDEARAAPGELGLICLGPLTNLARAMQLEPSLASLLGPVVIMGGSVGGVGNVTPTAEFNIYYDPESARQVFLSSVAKTLVPLDVTSEIVFGLDLLHNLPDETTRAGKLLGKVLPFAFRACRQHLGLEGIHLHDVVGVAAAVHPELFTMCDLGGDVETGGELTRGMTVFDRRPHGRQRGGMEVALEVDAAAVADYIVRGLNDAGIAT